MSIYEELRTLVATASARDDEFGHIANAFPGRLLAAMEKYLEFPPGILAILAPSLNIPVSGWIPWSGQLTNSDINEMGFFTISIVITLPYSGPASDWSYYWRYYPIFAFRPVTGGIEAHCMKKLRSGEYELGQETLISDEASFGPLLAECVGRLREHLSSDPFATRFRPSEIGFETNPRRKENP